VIYVLVHSPLVGPSTWTPVAERLNARGVTALVPDLHISQDADLPYWLRHSSAVASALAHLPSDASLILVAHSGAGLLLPAIREAIGRPVAAYVFVDAGIPEDGKSRLDLLRSEMPEAAEAAHRTLLAGGRVPNWTDASLQNALPDPAQRRTVLMEMYPQAMAFYSEPIPVPPYWPDAPCAYIQFTPIYDMHADRARRDGWDFLRLEGGHFHMLVDPGAVAEVIIQLAESSTQPGVRPQWSP
jgi:hypothetical protein